MDAATARETAETVRVLVSPLVYANVTAWRTAVHDALRRLLRADQAMTILPVDSDLILSHDFDDDVLRSLRSWFSGFTPEGRINLADPVVNQWNDRRRAMGLQVYTRDIINHAIDRRVLESPFVQEALFPNRVKYWQGVYAVGPGNTDALLWASHARTSDATFGSTTADLLGILVPAFQAGLSALHRLDQARTTLDAVSAPLLVFDADGRERHRSPAAVTLLARDPAGATLVARARTLATDVARTAPGAPAAAQPATVSADVTTLSARYALRATVLPAGTFGAAPSVLVMLIGGVAPEVPAASVLAERHGLTPREAEVARQLAQGATRNAIASALAISPFTARAHEERIFRKLGVSTRAAVALALLGARPAGARD